MATNHEVKNALNAKALAAHIDKPLDQLRGIRADYAAKGKALPQGINAALERAEIAELSSPEAVNERRRQQAIEAAPRTSQGVPDQADESTK